MQTDVYDALIRQAHTHWWFQARQQILLRFVAAHGETLFRGGAGSRILDVGAGAGQFATAMTRHGAVSVLEGAPEVLDVLGQNPALNVHRGFLPRTNLPGEHYDFVTALDVLEHVQDDLSACQEIGRLLKPEGHLLLTVPAHPFLWSDHDTIHHHFRRYRPGEVQALLIKAGFQVVFQTPFQFYLFPALVLNRVFRRLTRRKAGKVRLGTPPAPVNNLLRWIFSREAGWLAKGRSFPIGSSHLALARKPGPDPRRTSVRNPGPD